jgi:hypothetical protein
VHVWCGTVWLLAHYWCRELSLCPLQEYVQLGNFPSLGFHLIPELRLVLFEDRDQLLKPSDFRIHGLLRRGYRLWFCLGRSPFLVLVGDLDAN